MTAVLELNRTLVVSKSELEAAVGAQPPLIGLLEGLLVRVTVPKRDWERLYVTVVAAVGVGCSPARIEHEANTALGRQITTRASELRTSMASAQSPSCHRVGIVRSVVFHAASDGQPPAPYFLVDLGDAQETFSLKQCAKPTSDATNAAQCMDEELSLMTRVALLLGKQLTPTERHAALAANLAHLKSLVSGSRVGDAGLAAGHFTLSSTSSRIKEGSAAADGNHSTAANLELLVQKQRDLINQLQQDVESKNRELYQLSLRARDVQQGNDEKLLERDELIRNMSDRLDKQTREFDMFKVKLQPLKDTVGQLHQLLKLAREKLGMPGASIELIERALREAQVVPRSSSGTSSA